ncbi:HEAT repeat domain-containing protein [Halorhabdus sp. CBA1104]|uniref:HEAT repeat domain-containing protein n=1 Tax=Halorhabdus sp. CBA1104 TaxID=1380432 RepID=UPI0012B3A994|nr:HEAT repeat domain-containing protein [Halorhabdus sp. CBA1104]QGN07498.1 HEAT repeat domain-containing protein [Halorhabdus sp. CBA1104]
MSDEDSEADGDGDIDAEPGTVAFFEERLDAAETALEAAETEADLDDIAATLADIETDLDAAELPTPDEEDEDDPQEVLESRLSSLRDGIEEQRGPYVEDVAEDVEAAGATAQDTRWTDDGQTQVLDAVAAFGEAVDGHVEVEKVESAQEAGDALWATSEAIAALDLGPDEDSDAIATLRTAAQTLNDDLEAAQAYEDLSVREKLTFEGFYEVIEGDHQKDYPPELNAILVWEKRYKDHRDPEDVEPILLAFELLDSEFMEENILDVFERIAPPEAYEPVQQRASRRDKQAVRVLGKIGDQRAVETLVDFIDGDGDPALQRVTLQALGEIGSHEATQAVANRLAADTDSVRSAAARALGLLGDTRAIEPLTDVLAEDDADEVRASAAWALNQIGTERALEIAAEYADDRAYVVQVEAEKAAGV